MCELGAGICKCAVCVCVCVCCKPLLLGALWIKGHTKIQSCHWLPAPSSPWLASACLACAFQPPLEPKVRYSGPIASKFRRMASGKLLLQVRPVTWRRLYLGTTVLCRRRVAVFAFSALSFHPRQLILSTQRQVNCSQFHPSFIRRETHSNHIYSPSLHRNILRTADSLLISHQWQPTKYTSTSNHQRELFLSIFPLSLLSTVNF